MFRLAFPDAEYRANLGPGRFQILPRGAQHDAKTPPQSITGYVRIATVLGHSLHTEHEGGLLTRQLGQMHAPITARPTPLPRAWQICGAPGP